MGTTTSTSTSTSSSSSSTTTTTAAALAQVGSTNYQSDCGWQKTILHDPAYRIPWESFIFACTTMMQAFCIDRKIFLNTIIIIA